MCVTIKHDAFAREELQRQVVTTTSGCDWCGQNHHGRLFRYAITQDGLMKRRNWLKGLFCSISCMRAYNE